jgi:hypothetical protein
LKTVQAFLSNRVAVLSVSGFSLSKPVRLGCPQGGVLSLFPWNILVDDLLRLTFNFPVKTLGYADDISIATSHKDPAIASQNLQTACDAVVSWLGSRKLFLNPIKTVLILFSRKTTNWPDLKISINNVVIRPSQTTWEWKEHLKTKCASAKRALYAVNSCLRQTFGSDSKRLHFLYHTTVEPILTYGCSVWLTVLKTKAGTRVLRSFQRSAARLITRCFKTAPTEALLVLSKLLPLDFKMLSLASMRFLATQDLANFAPSATKILASRIPVVLNSQKPKIASSVNLPGHPPWAFKFFATYLTEKTFDLCPSDPATLRFAIYFHNKGEVVSFARWYRTIQGF